MERTSLHNMGNNNNSRGKLGIVETNTKTKQLEIFKSLEFLFYWEKQKVLLRDIAV